MEKAKSAESAFTRNEYLITGKGHFDRARGAATEVWRIQDENHFPRTLFSFGSATDSKISPADIIGQILLEAILKRDNIEYQKTPSNPYIPEVLN